MDKKQPFEKTAKLGAVSSLALIAANLVPLLGVLFYDWNVAFVLALFWIENLVIGLFNLLKMWTLALINRRVSGLPVSLFFVLHYGIFCMGHGTLLWSLLNMGELPVDQYFPDVASGFASLFAQGGAVFMGFFAEFGRPLALAVLALIASHSVAFIETFVLSGDIWRKRIGELMGEPYPRILIMHVGLLGGALLLERLGSPTWLLAIMVVLKIIVDVSRYRRTKQH
ncbi:hypothetical protein GCM10008090_30130 [Arenicella chitinivorans]|uniref:Uncharacterized protein n=1 Tax=Arenicella chitinivorans TaxID=1329800 RepID=A0A918S2D5_9GAMM|nr:DUF6498-containing protein [Arenicella chitinivorans]GHA18511.1 hypothetical protein GCM10008090_30130 [Arenicella chitinivorans]